MIDGSLHEDTEPPTLAIGDARSAHLLDVVFDVIDRRAISSDEAGGDVLIDGMSAPVSPTPWEIGYDDAVIAYPGQVTRAASSSDDPHGSCGHATCRESVLPDDAT
jgi:hypothetical protein